MIYFLQKEEIIGKHTNQSTKYLCHYSLFEVLREIICCDVKDVLYVYVAIVSSHTNETTKTFKYKLKCC